MADDADEKRKPGRPPGTGAVARLRRELLAGGKLDALVTAVYARALAGDMAAARLLLERAVPALRPQAEAVQFTLPAGTLTERALALLEAAAAGELPADVASDLIRSIGTVVGIEEGDELRKRLDAMQYGEFA